MKVLFVVKSKVMENLGVMYLSAVVKEAGHEAKICDIDEAFVMAKIWKPNIIGYSIMTGDDARFRALNEKILFALKYKPQVLVGGADPTFFSEGYGWATVIPGEAEQDIADLLQSGLKYPNIDSLPHPDRTDFPNMPMRDFISSRGCPWACRYCFNDRWAKMFPEFSKVRTRSVEDVIKEINAVSPEFVYFQDSTFGVHTGWLKKFSIMYRSQINIPFHAHMRPSQITKERVGYLVDSNCYSIRIALETASDKLRKLIGRPHTSNEECVQASRLLKKYGIQLMIQNMIGIATSTIEDDLNTLEVNIRCKPDYAWVSIFAPYHGTELGDQCVKEGWFKGNYNDISDSFFNKSVLEFSEEYKEQMYCLQKIFAFCVEVQVMPEVSELTYENLPKFIHRAMRKVGDSRLYGGIL